MKLFPTAGVVTVEWAPLAGARLGSIPIAAIRADVGVIDTGRKASRFVDFRALRRTCATSFGDRAKDPKSTQAQLRHADPAITLKHYQKSVPASVKAAAIALENDLTGNHSERVLSGPTVQTSVKSL